ncbi:MAG: PIN domain-containing protein [Deltaproteobacteria bacterium]|nr:PIN domain-containing protein [Deltaproteobacteria bacterium]
MKSRILLDSGPLVAFLNDREDHHEWVRAQVSAMPAPLVTCEPVLAEACYLLRRTRGGSGAVVSLLERGLLKVGMSAEHEAVALGRLLARYRNVPMSLADACLVRMTELESRSVVLTLDSDFLIYRRNGRQVIPTIMPRRH